MGDLAPDSGVFEVIAISPTAARVKLRAAEMEKAIARVVRSGRYQQGPEVEAFEQELAELLGAEHCLGVGSGTDALSIALRAAGIAAGDEVLTAALAPLATVAAIELCGAAPVLVDVEPATRCLDPTALEAAIGPRCRAVVVVHSYGQPADLPRIVPLARAHGLLLIEDCSQALGASIGGVHVGNAGDAAAFAFEPEGAFGGTGDAGAVVTGEPALAERVRRLRNLGRDARGDCVLAGMSSRLDELQAAVLRALLATAWEDVRRRQQIADAYERALAGSSVVTPLRAPGTEHALSSYVIETAGRDGMADALRDHGVATAHDRTPIHLQPAYRGRLRHGALPVTERFYRRHLTLPLYAELDDDSVQYVCQALMRAAPTLEPSSTR